jgi:hypothetical protein
MKSLKFSLWLLVASLALNVFLGVTLGMRAFHAPPPPRPERAIEEMARSLPAADAQILRDALNTHRGVLEGEEDDDPRQYHERMRRILLAEPFDAEAFRQMASEFHARRERVGSVLGEILADALPRMSPEGRKAMADFRPPPPPRRP